MKEVMPPRKNRALYLSIIILGLSVICASCCCLSGLEIAEPDIEIREAYPGATGVNAAQPPSLLGHSEDTFPSR